MKLFLVFETAKIVSDCKTKVMIVSKLHGHNI